MSIKRQKRVTSTCAVIFFLLDIELAAVSAQDININYSITHEIVHKINIIDDKHHHFGTIVQMLAYVLSTHWHIIAFKADVLATLAWI